MGSRKRKPEIDAVVADLKNEHYSSREVAEKHNIPLERIYQIAQIRNVKLRNKVKPHHRKIIDAIQSQNLTRAQAAEKFNVSGGVVEYVCEKYGAKAPRPIRYPLLRNRDWLYKQLVEEQRKYREIAEMVGCTHQRVQQRVNELGWQDKRKRRKHKRRK